MRIVIKYIAIAFAVLLSSFELSAQKGKLYVHPYKGDSVQLRWFITDVPLWQQCKKAGVDVYRKTVQTGEMKKVNDTAIRALSILEWTKRFAEFSNGKYILRKELPGPEKTALTCTYPEEMKFDFEIPRSESLDWGSDKQSIYCLFYNISVIDGVRTAKHAGAFFTDKTTVAGTNYVYYLVKAGDKPENFIDTVRINSSFYVPKSKALITAGKATKKAAEITYARVDTAYRYYSHYALYRSNTLTGEYKRIGKRELAMYEIYQKDTVPHFLVDTSIEKNKTYFYKVLGYDIFGDSTQLSDAFKVREFTPLGAAPVLTKFDNINNKYNQLEWTFDSSLVKDVVSFSLYRSKDAFVGYSAIASNLKTDVRMYQDKQYSDASYYKVMALGIAGDTVWSAPHLIFLNDSIPPQKPQITSAKCDSTGVVRLAWKHGNETDLRGFIIYRANYKTEEFSRVCSIERDTLTKKLDTVYFDTITLRALDPSVYYKISAFDGMYNSSGYSEIVKAERYDTLKPNNPVFKSRKNEIGKISLIWACSSSLDVEYSVLYRKINGESQWHEIYRYTQCDTSGFMNYTDTNIVRRTWYEYMLQSVDVHGLRSEASDVMQVQAADNGLRAAIKEFHAEANIQKHAVKLSWNYQHAGVARYVIYRAKKAGKFTICASVEPNQAEYFDFETASAIEYTYKMKAVYVDNAQSPITEEIKIQY